MFKISIIILFCCLQLTLYGQHKISNDSLIQLLETEPDTQKIKIYHTLFNRLLYKNTIEARKYAQAAKKIALSRGDTLSVAQSLDKEGISFAVGGDMPAALKAFIESFHFYQLKNDLLGMAKEQKGIGNVHQMIGDMEKAIEHHIRSLEMYRQYGDTSNIIAALNNVGICYKSDAQLDSAIFYFEKRLDWSRKAKNMTSVASSLNNLAGALKDQENFDASEKYYLEALDIRKEQGSKKYIGLVEGNLGELYFKKGQLLKSRQYFEQSIQNRMSVGDLRGVALNNIRLSQTLNALGANTQAEAVAQKGLEIAKELKILDFQIDAYDQLQKSYVAQNDFKSAYQAKGNFIELQDSFLNMEKAKYIAELETKFEATLQDEKLAQQGAQIKLLESKNKVEFRFRFLLIGIGVLLLVSLGLLFNRFQLKQKSERFLSIKNEEIFEKNKAIKGMNKELEKKMLRAQMDPHFIFNSLNSIQHFITTNEKKLAMKYLSKFSKLIRKVLDNSINDRVPLIEELALLEDYMELEALRLNHSFTHEIEIAKNLDVHNIEVPFLIIQPYVENAIKHGLKNKNGPGKLTIRLSDKGDSVHCIIQDNGIGREAAKKFSLARRGHVSHGMSVTQKRLDILNKSNKLKTEVLIYDLTNDLGLSIGTKIELTIPYDLN